MPKAPVLGTVTLITGDRVTLSRKGPHVTPGPGRASIAYSIRHDHDHVFVIPNDVLPQLAADELDLSLFDVTTLLTERDGDADRTDLPLIVTHVTDPTAMQPRLAPRGVTTAHALPTLHMMTMRQPKANPGAALSCLPSLAPRALVAGAGAPPTKIWLDRKRKPTDDQSLAQIGGVAAHARGFTGKGVTVAVVDSGIDVTHPDLVGKVIASQDFTGDGQGTIDTAGHGTHVAGIIAGTGAASAGRFVGVAPDAQLINARVCSGEACSDSAILAGLEWAAVDQGAKIVNVSLGGPDGPGLDPLELAVNQLSADLGTLFVIAAGNDGASVNKASINSPGSADAALTVGAVDPFDQLAVFSSIGPRLGDDAIKPDLTAPGVNIISARAHNILLGTPFDQNYTILSGTSMATPHVAGSAALLLQEHPDWTGAQIKAQLMGTALPNPTVGVFRQGAGRVDVDRATRQPGITVTPPEINFGAAISPHDDDPPIVRTVTYHNDGTAPITLALTAAIGTPDGSPSASRLTLSATSLTIPAGGDAALTATLDIGGPGVDGFYGGAILATNGDLRVETPIGVHREAPSGNVTFHVRDEAGAPAAMNLNVTGPDGFVVRPIVDGDVLRLADGAYEMYGFVGDSFDFLAAPVFFVTGDTELDFDARLAKPVAFDVGDPGVQNFATLVSWRNAVTGGQTTQGALIAELKSAQIGPDAPPDLVVSWVTQYLSDVPGGTATRVYGLAHAERDHVPTGWTERVRRDQLSTVDFDVAARADEVYGMGAEFFPTATVQGLPGESSVLDSVYMGPSHHTEHYYAPDFLIEIEHDGALGRSCGERTYLPGHHYHEEWNRAVFGPGVPDDQAIDATGTLVHASAGHRVGDLLQLNPTLLGGQSAMQFGQVCEACLLAPEHVELFIDGAPLYQLDGFAADALPPLPVPPDAATYRYERGAQFDPSIVALSTEVDAAWTFQSGHVDDTSIVSLPLIGMRFQPPVDDHNEVHGRVIAMPIQFSRPIAKATLDVSFNDGRSWTAVPVIALGDLGLAVILHPPGAQLVSLRGTATDRDGDQLEQTIIRAYPVSP